MAQHRLGKKDVALKSLAAAIMSFDWRRDRGDIRDVWICHLLRREAEALILHQPTGVSSRELSTT